jgi:hypothetical protein
MECRSKSLINQSLRYTRFVRLIAAGSVSPTLQISTLQAALRFLSEWQPWMFLVSANLKQSVFFSNGPTREHCYQKSGDPLRRIECLCVQGDECVERLLLSYQSPSDLWCALALHVSCMQHNPARTIPVGIGTVAAFFEKGSGSHIESA